MIFGGAFQGFRAHVGIAMIDAWAGTPATAPLVVDTAEDQHTCIRAVKSTYLEMLAGRQYIVSACPSTRVWRSVGEHRRRGGTCSVPQDDSLAGRRGVVLAHINTPGEDARYHALDAVESVARRSTVRRVGATRRVRVRIRTSRRRDMATYRCVPTQGISCRALDMRDKHTSTTSAPTSCSLDGKRPASWSRALGLWNAPIAGRRHDVESAHSCTCACRM